MSFDPQSAHLRRRGTTIDDILSSNQSSPGTTRRMSYSTNQQQRSNQRSLSMSPLKTRRQSSIRTNQTLKPIIQRRSTLFNSTISQLIRVTGIPKLNPDDDTYISETFKNENTSKFVIGTLWNTFALVNNLFLQRPRKRRDAITGENIQAEQLARLQQIYSFAERNQNDQQTSTENLQSIIDDIISPTTRIENLQTIISDLTLTNRKPLCTCYGNHHVQTCQFYDHSLPYIKTFVDRTVQLENIYLDVQQSNRPIYRDATTQSDLGKPPRIFTHFKTINHVSTQSSPIQHFKQIYTNVSTQCSPIESQRKYSNDFQLSKHINHQYINMSTQTIVPKKDFLDSSTQFSPMNSKHIYVNTAIQSSPIESENVSTQYTPDEPPIPPRKLIDTKQKTIINDRKTNPIKEIKPIGNSSQSIQDKKPNPNVKNLVSLFETTLPMKKPTYIIPLKSIKTDRNIPISSRDTTCQAIDQYTNGIVSNIVDSAIRTASETIVQTNEQLQKRFSLYKNGGGHGKNLLFQSNTFLPSPEQTNKNIEPNIRVESQASSVFLNDHNQPSNESQHTLIVGHYVDGNESKRKKRTHSTVESHFNIDYSTSNDDDDDDDDDDDGEANLDEQIDRQQFLSNSQLFSAQELYIRPWLVRRATAPDIHCLDTDITDTRVEMFPLSSQQTYFHVFPSRQRHLDVYTRLTCLVTILFYLDYVHDRYSNQILYDEIQQIENDLLTPSSSSSTTTTTPPIIHSNTFQTINPDGSKRYRTGLVLDVNSTENIQSRQILSQQIQWKRVKILVRRFRKKYLYYKQLMKNDRQKPSNQRNIQEFFKYFDSTSKRRIKKYAKHYAQKL